MRSVLARLRPTLARAAPPVTDRIALALHARQHGVNDFFGGWEPGDLKLLARYRVEPAAVPAVDEIVNWLGIRTATALHAWLTLPPDRRITIPSLPVPDDQVHAETIEYVALLVALERALAHGSGQFTVYELGASYAPWAVAAGVVALRHGIGKVTLTAVEASSASVGGITAHAARNGLLPNDRVVLHAIHGAIHVTDGELFFPRVDVASDNGGQVTDTPAERDYRGLALDHEPVPAYSLATLAADHERIDFLHMDVQGAEAALLTDAGFIDVLDRKVATLFLATQSRLIEGLALERLGAAGWLLLRERPTMFRQNDRTSDINGWTLRDGGQLWLNPALGRHHCDY